MERFFEVDYGDAVFTSSRRQDEVERYARLDGCYVICSNAAPDRQSAQDLRERYKELKYVEQAFRKVAGYHGLPWLPQP